MAVSTFGAKIYRNGNLVGSVNNVGGLELELDEEDATTHESAHGAVEKIGTILSVGNVKVEGFFDPDDSDGQIGLKEDMLNRTMQTFELVFPPDLNASWTFDAIVSKWKPGDTPVRGALSFEAELSISGLPTLNIGASAGLTTPFFAASAGDIVPVPAGDVYNYVVMIPKATETVTITPTATKGTITITADGASQVVSSGSASTAIPLGAAGSVTVATIDVREGSKVPSIYTLQLVRKSA